MMPPQTANHISFVKGDTASDELNNDFSTSRYVKENRFVSTVPIDKNVISWIEYPKDDNGLEEYMQFLSTRLLVIEKEKQKLELERQDILQTLWGHNNLLSHLDNNSPSINITNSTSIADKSELIPFRHLKQHTYTNSQSLNEILELCTPNRCTNEDNHNLFDGMDFAKLDLDTLNSILSHFGIRSITNVEFNQGVELLNHIRNYLMENTNDINVNVETVNKKVENSENEEKIDTIMDLEIDKLHSNFNFEWTVNVNSVEAATPDVKDDIDELLRSVAHDTR